MANKIVILIGNWLYNNMYILYKPLYFLFKYYTDRNEIALLKSVVKPGITILDIGANIGFYTTIFSKAVGPKGQVSSFEPDITNYHHLRENTKGLSNVQIHHKAVASETQNILLYTSKEINVDHRTYKHEKFDQKIEITAISLDEFVKNNEGIDVIKIDIQGFEMQAMKGMTHILKNNHNIRIFSEFWPYGLKMAGSSVLEYYEHLTNLGFLVYMFTAKGLIPLNIEAVQGMILLDKNHYFNIYATRHVDEISF
ncbi:MAG: FkbM family methyltransferase [Mariniphaga sp.]